MALNAEYDALKDGYCKGPGKTKDWSTVRSNLLYFDDLERK